MIGPTGVGKTEIARRLAKLAGAPFIKVEATKFTEVGYCRRDVEQIIAIWSKSRSRKLASASARTYRPGPTRRRGPRARRLVGANAGAATPRFVFAECAQVSSTTKEIDGRDAILPGGMRCSKSRACRAPKWRDLDRRIFGKMGGRTKTPPPHGRGFPRASGQRGIRQAVDSDQLTQESIHAVEITACVVSDEIDKICVRDGRSGGDVSREGVQRDLLPLIEAPRCRPKHGAVKTDHILSSPRARFISPSRTCCGIAGRCRSRSNWRP